MSPLNPSDGDDGYVDGEDVVDVAEIFDLMDTCDDVRSDLVTFVRTLRQAGVDVPVNAGVTAARAMVEVGFNDEERARAALRAVLVSRQEDLDTFNRMFEEFWRRLDAHLSPDAEAGSIEDDDDHPDGGLASDIGTNADSAEIRDRDEGTSAESGTESVDATTVASEAMLGGPDSKATADDETVATATYSPDGRPERVTVRVNPRAADDVVEAVRRVGSALATLRGRRWQQVSDGERADTRRSLRQSISTGGAIVSLSEQERKQSALRCLVLADVSRSVLDTIDRGFLVHFLGTLQTELRSCRLFFFDNSIHEVTAAFDKPSIRDAVQALQQAETAWGGGTRIGNAVTAIRETHPEAVDRRTSVMILSDGLEMGDVSGLADGMAWLSRRAGTVLWLNPLAISPAYEPTAEGMATALPYVDGLFALSGPTDLAELARQLERHGRTGRIGYEYDPRRMRESEATTYD